MEYNDAKDWLGGINYFTVQELEEKLVQFPEYRNVMAYKANAESVNSTIQFLGTDLPKYSSGLNELGKSIGGGILDGASIIDGIKTGDPLLDLIKKMFVFGFQFSAIGVVVAGVLSKVAIDVAGEFGKVVAYSSGAIANGIEKFKTKDMQREMANRMILESYYLTKDNNSSLAQEYYDALSKYTDDVKIDFENGELFVKNDGGKFVSISNENLFELIQHGKKVIEIEKNYGLNRDVVNKERSAISSQQINKQKLEFRT